MKARVLTAIPVFLMTLYSFSILISVLSGNIGNNESWRVIFSLLAFTIFLLGTVLSAYSLMKGDKA